MDPEASNSEYFDGGVDGGCDCTGGSVSGGGLAAGIWSDLTDWKSGYGGKAATLIAAGLVLCVVFLIASYFAPETFSFPVAGWFLTVFTILNLLADTPLRRVLNGTASNVVV